jgi:hypothetical protein
VDGGVAAGGVVEDDDRITGREFRLPAVGDAEGGGDQDEGTLMPR